MREFTKSDINEILFLAIQLIQSDNELGKFSREFVKGLIEMLPENEKEEKYVKMFLNYYKCVEKRDKKSEWEMSDPFGQKTIV